MREIERERMRERERNSYLESPGGVKILMVEPGRAASDKPHLNQIV